MPETAPYGSWKSPITPDLIVSNMIGLGQIATDGEVIYWAELRPSEQGRMALMRRLPDGALEDLLPQPWNVRTRVHEYGGGSYLVHKGVIYFSNFADQRFYRFEPGGEPQPLTPTIDLRYADGVMDERRGRVICVREDHTTSDQQAQNTIAAVRVDGGDLQTGGRVLASGRDFYASPRLDPAGRRLAWLQWDHPNMPWDGTELWVADIGADEGLENPRKVAGGPSESIFQPEWSPEGDLFFISDRSGWWNLYCWQNGQAVNLHPMEAEFGTPQWVFGLSTYSFESSRRIVCMYSLNGADYLAVLDPASKAFQNINTPFSDLFGIHSLPGKAVFHAASPTQSDALVMLDLSSGQVTIFRKSTDISIDPGYISVAQPIEFPTENGLTAYAYYYPPHNKDFSAPAGELPPLIVESHGGPTGSTSGGFDLQKQFWTSRGFAIVDVNYGGSTGYGREYRQRLNGQWGIVDVDDSVNAALFLANTGRADINRLAIRGGSAGGYTTLCALTFRNVFKAGASYFGVSDAEALALDTHKFESRYLDNMIGPYPAAKNVYVERSPIHFTDQLDCALILFQGAEDRVVPPDQSRKMFEAARAKGLLTAYLEYPGEQHGFRRAEHIKRSLDAELYFYSRVFGFELPEPVEPVKIENL